jgi:anti-sigma-K factor RskA
MDVHELTAGYALDALDPAERGRFEEHLASCDRCRDELEGFWLVSGGLARAAGGPPPPGSLRDRILAQARSERPNVVPLRQRFGMPAMRTLAAAAAVLAIGLGVWATSVSRELDDAKQELAVLEDPDAQEFESADGQARLVVTPAGEAALVVRGLPAAPDGKDYEIWVFQGDVPRPAGLFDESGVALLERRVAPGQVVAVTLEREGGVDAPTGQPLFTATRT